MAGASCEQWIWGRMAQGSIDAMLEGARQRQVDGDPLSDADQAKVNDFLQQTKDKASDMAMAIGTGKPL